MANTAPLRIVYMFEDGEESDLAVGTITRDGIISILKTAPGEDARVETIVTEINETERVFVRDKPANPGGSERSTLIKRSIVRGEDDFLSALQANALRFYRTELRFDPEILNGPAGLDPAPDTTLNAADDAEEDADLIDTEFTPDLDDPDIEQINSIADI